MAGQVWVAVVVFVGYGDILHTGEGDASSCNPLVGSRGVGNEISMDLVETVLL